MDLQKFIDDTDLQRSLLLGYYGGGNYGDELLLEVLQNILRANGVEHVMIGYQRPADFTVMHHDVGYQLIDMRSKWQLLKATLRSRNVIIGGGGLWGVDINTNTALMSLYLLACRLLGKRVYLLGVGYYRSTNRLGHFAAWCAAKAANLVLARDPESFANFGKFTSKVQLDKDMAHYLPQLDLNSYRQDVKALDAKFKLDSKRKTLLLTLRRLQGHKAAKTQKYAQAVEAIIKSNRDKPIIVALLELEPVDPANFALARAWAKKYDNVQLLDFPVNPIALFGFMQMHRTRLVVVALQFHIIISAHLSRVPFWPVSYDNKVSELLKSIGMRRDIIEVDAVSQEAVQAFINRHFTRGGS